MHHPSPVARIVERLKEVEGLQALVLGGSYASGAQRPDSDIDIGLYYRHDRPLDIDQIRAIAASLNDFPDPVVTALGGWGRWVNGGAWLTIEGQRVDFLYRDIDFVSSILDDCQAGQIQLDYWQQPAYGFHSYMYCAETQNCQPLYDPDQLIRALKAKVALYPPLLKQTIIKSFLWSARFTLENTHKAARQENVYMTVGCLARAIHALIQMLYALNETYYISEKRVYQDVHRFRIRPANFLERVSLILGAAGSRSETLKRALAEAEALLEETTALSEAQHSQSADPG